MRYENEPDQAANNQGYSGENYCLLQYIHVLLLISIMSLATGARSNISRLDEAQCKFVCRNVCIEESLVARVRRVTHKISLQL